MVPHLAIPVITCAEPASNPIEITPFVTILLDAACYHSWPVLRLRHILLKSHLFFYYTHITVASQVAGNIKYIHYPALLCQRQYITLHYRQHLCLCNYPWKLVGLGRPLIYNFAISSWLSILTLGWDSTYIINRPQFA